MYKETTSKSPALWLILACVSVYGQTQAQEGLPLAGNASQEEGLHARVSSELSYDDNILFQKTDTTGSRIWFLNPRLGFAYQSPGTEVAVSYSLAHSEYLDSQVDSHTRHNLDYNLSKKFNKFNKLTLQGSLQSGFEQRGLSFNEGANARALDAPTPILNTAATLSYQLGADTARMRVIGSAGVRDTDRDSPLIVDDSRDFAEDLLGLQLLYRVGWRTDLVAEVRKRDIDYLRTPIGAGGEVQNLDSTERQNLIGLDLRASAKTTARLRVGTVEREPRWETAQWEDAPEAPVLQELDDPFADNEAAASADSAGSSGYWELTGVWAPRTYSTFTLSTSVTNRETLNVGNFVRSEQHTLQWMHRWNGWLQTEFDVQFGTDAYVGSARRDKRRALNARMLYTLDSLTTLGIGVRKQSMHSTLETVGFDKWVYYMYFNYSDMLGN